MGEGIFFAVAAALFLLMSLYFGELLLFRCREKNAFEKRGENASYWLELQSRYRKTKRKRKRNFRLYLMISYHRDQGEEEKALLLEKFLKPDPLLGISKA